MGVPLLQGELHSEKMRNKTLRYTLMNMQDDSLSALNKALIPATAAQTVPARMRFSSQVASLALQRSMHRMRFMLVAKELLRSSNGCESRLSRPCPPG